MPVSPLNLSEALANRCSQVLYRCMEEVGSTKGALYLRVPGQGAFEVVSFYGWPRGTRPPVSIPGGHPLLVRTQRARRTYVVNDASESPELSAFGQGGEWPRYLITPVYLQGDWVGLLIQRDRIKGGTFEVERDELPTLAICGDLVAALKEFRLYGGPEAAAPRAVGPGVVPEGLPTAADLLEELAPEVERLLPPARSAPARPPTSAGPSPAPVSREHLYGFPGGRETYSSLPWEADRTLSGWVAPANRNAERRPGMVPPEQRAFFWEIAGLISQILPVTAVALWIEDPEEIRPVLAFSTLPLSPDLQQQILAHATDRKSTRLNSSH